jgi:hypothetical protein
MPTGNEPWWLLVPQRSVANAYLHNLLYSGDDAEVGASNQDMELLRYAEQLSKAEVPEPIRQRILADRAAGPATGVKVTLTVNTPSQT